MSLRNHLMIVLLTALLAGCASQQPRFDTSKLNVTLTPQQAAADSAAGGQRVLWGGTVINASNLADATQLEVLAYPLDEDQRPMTDRNPLGRFLVVKEGYLETADYGPGRLVTVAGTIDGTNEGKVGQARYTYPVVRAEDLQLWSREPRYRGSVQPRFGVGIGIGIGID